MPLNKRPQPITTPSSPLETMNTLKLIEPVTPPVTPVRPIYGRSLLSTGSITLSSVKEEGLEDSPSADTLQGARKSSAWEATSPRPNTESYKLHSSTTSGFEYGRGVWSVVHRAYAIASPSSAPPTPPNSPTNAADPLPIVPMAYSQSRLQLVEMRTKSSTTKQESSHTSTHFLVRMSMSSPSMAMMARRTP